METLSIPLKKLLLFTQRLLEAGQHQVSQATLQRHIDDWVQPPSVLPHDLSSIGALPVPLLHEVCSYLFVEDQISWGLCNRRFYHKILRTSAAWSTLHFKYAHNLEMSSPFDFGQTFLHRIAPYLTHVQLRSTDCLMTMKTCVFPRLTHLTWAPAPYNVWSALCRFPQLQCLSVSGGTRSTTRCYIKDPPPELPGFTALRSLSMQHSMYGSAEFLSSLQSTLTELDLYGSTFAADTSTKTWSVVNTLTRLQKLRVSGRYGTKIDSLATFSSLSQLTDLSLHGCDSLTSLQGLQPTLLKLTLSACNEVIDYTGLQSLTRLQSLSINFNFSLKNLEPLVPLTSLRSLDLYAVKLKSLSGIEGLVQLCKLYLDNQKDIRDLETLSRLSQLAELSLVSCRHSSYRFLGPLSALRVLDLSYSYVQSNDLLVLSSCHQLHHLNLTGCRFVREVPELVRSLPALKTLVR